MIENLRYHHLVVFDHETTLAVLRAGPQERKATRTLVYPQVRAFTSVGRRCSIPASLQIGTSRLLSPATRHQTVQNGTLMLKQFGSRRINPEIQAVAIGIRARHLLGPYLHCRERVVWVPPIAFHSNSPVSKSVTPIDPEIVPQPKRSPDCPLAPQQVRTRRNPRISRAWEREQLVDGGPHKRGPFELKSGPATGPCAIPRTISKWRDSVYNGLYQNSGHELFNCVNNVVVQGFCQFKWKANMSV